MKKLFFVLILTFGFLSNAFAHYLWIETNPAGSINEVQQVKIFYGEYTYDYYEKVDGNFEDVQDFKLWLITPSGEVRELSFKKGGETFYEASFTPEIKGTYRLVLNSNQTEVVDWSSYDLGVLKPNFYASTTVQVGSSESKDLSTDKAPLLLSVNARNFEKQDSAEVSVSFKGNPVAEQELVIAVADQWTKTVSTDENGKVTFALPWSSQYIIEAVHTEDSSGSFNDQEYKSIRHTSTLTIKVQ